MSQGPTIPAKDEPRYEVTTPSGAHVLTVYGSIDEAAAAIHGLSAVLGHPLIVRRLDVRARDSPTLIRRIQARRTCTPRTPR